MKRVAIEGIDGAGKTSVVEELEAMLRDEGQHIATCGLYRETQARHEIHLYDMWQSREGAAHAVDLLQQTAHDVEKAAEHDGVDVLLYDRHWMTAFVELQAIAPEIMATWVDLPQTVYLRAKPEVTLDRTVNDHDEPWANINHQRIYADRYEKIAQQYMRSILGIYRSDTDVTPHQIARNVVWDMHIAR